MLFRSKKFLTETKITTNSQKLDEFYYFGDTSPEFQRAKNKPQDVLSKRKPGQVASGDKEDYKDVVKKKGKLGNYYGNKGPKGPLPEGVEDYSDININKIMDMAHAYMLEKCPEGPKNPGLYMKCVNELDNMFKSTINNIKGNAGM